MLTCQCPAATSLTTIPSATCPQNFGQTQKLAFQRLSDGTTKNSFTTTAGIQLKASWTAKLSANDSTKIVVTPYINNPATEPGAARTVGGGNESINGIAKIIGREATAFTASLNGYKQDIIKAIKSLECEAQVLNLGVYLFNENGQILAVQDAETETTYYPIPIQSLFVGDLSLGGLEAEDANALQFSFAPNWSDNVVIVTPSDFNPLTDL